MNVHRATMPVESFLPFAAVRDRSFTLISNFSAAFIDLSIPVRRRWKLSGVSNIDLVIKLIHFAQDRWLARLKLTTSFSTNYLKQF